MEVVILIALLGLTLTITFLIMTSNREASVKHEPATDVVKHEPATPVAPRRITNDDFEIVRREFNGGPIITLVSGERLVVEEVLLYDVDKVAEINSLKAQASNELKGFTTGIGFWGSIDWVVAGSLALGAVEGMISNAKQKTGFQLLKLAAEKFNQLPNNSVFVSVDRILSLQTPNPQSWSATTRHGTARFIHNGEDFVTVRTADGGITFRWSQVASYVPPAEAQPLLPVPAAELGERLARLKAKLAKVDTARTPRHIDGAV